LAGMEVDKRSSEVVVSGGCLSVSGSGSVPGSRCASPEGWLLCCSESSSSGGPELAVLRVSRGEIKVRIALMLETQQRYAVREDYIAVVQRDGMRPIWRARLFEWLFEFVGEFGVSVSTVATAINFVDRYLSRVSTKKGLLQLVALAAMLVASKLHETAHAMSIATLQGLAEGIYLDSDIRLMELELLRVLNWQLDAVSPYCFLRYLVLYFEDVDAQLRTRVLSLAEAFLEIVLCEYAFLLFLPSETATASLLCAFEISQLSSSSLSKELWGSNIVDAGRVHDCKELLLCHVRNAFPEFSRSQSVVSPDCVASAAQAMDGADATQPHDLPAQPQTPPPPLPPQVR
jgi:hypothetical protein